MRHISRIIKLPESSIRKIVKKDLKLKFYRLVRCPNLNEKQNEREFYFQDGGGKTLKKFFTDALFSFQTRKFLRLKEVKIVKIPLYTLIVEKMHIKKVI